jgi:hypothetical protein
MTSDDLTWPVALPRGVECAGPASVANSKTQDSAVNRCVNFIWDLLSMIFQLRVSSPEFLFAGGHRYLDRTDLDPALSNSSVSCRTLLDG